MRQLTILLAVLAAVSTGPAAAQGLQSGTGISPSEGVSRVPGRTGPNAPGARRQALRHTRTRAHSAPTGNGTDASRPH